MLVMLFFCVFVVCFGRWLGVRGALEESDAQKQHASVNARERRRRPTRTKKKKPDEVAAQVAAEDVGGLAEADAGAAADRDQALQHGGELLLCAGVLRAGRWWRRGRGGRRQTQRRRSQQRASRP